MKRILISFFLLVCILIGSGCHPYQEPNEDIETIACFGDGRIQVLAEWRTSVKDDIGDYEYVHTAYPYKYQCYKLYDQKLKYAIQYTLYDYYQNGDIVYSFGNRGYVKIDIANYKIDVYNELTDIPEEEVKAFEQLAPCCPVKKVCFTKEDYTTAFATVSDEGEIFSKDNTTLDVLSQKRYRNQSTETG